MPVKIRGRGIEADKQSLHLWCRCNTCERRVGRLSLSLQGRSEKVLASQMGCWSAVILDWGAHPWRKHPGQCSAVGCGLQGRRMALTQGLKCCSLICGQFCLKGDLRGASPWLPCASSLCSATREAPAMRSLHTTARVDPDAATRAQPVQG